MPTAITQLALVTLDGAFQGLAWQGPTLSGSLKRVTPDLALWKPSRSRRCIWEQVLHATYWKLTILRVFDPGTELTLLRPGSNWPRPPEATPLTAERLWKADIARLHEVHAALRAAVAALPERRWNKRPRKPSSPNVRSMTYAGYLAGAAAHDAYHTGQIRLLKRLRAEA
ncbi:MAG TPA: DinB family protein [Phycisphaerales bacterium]|nr:DinB family protein [Phycisphaerales bacterium]